MKYFFSLLILFAFINAQSQFKADNVKYKTVYPEDLCKTLQANPGYTILDVRSDGEFYDSSNGSPSLNIGHVKNAKHIDIRQLPAKWKELQELKDKPLFIYCSHSQRSRRASRLLADSGFTKIFNINGGLTNFYVNSSHIPSCTEYLIAADDLPYKIISPAVLDEQIKKGNQYLLVDIRNDSVFNGTISTESRTAEGKLEQAINIPLPQLESSLSKIQIDKAVLLIDEDGNEGPRAARMLIDKGYKNVSILFNGMGEWVDYISTATSKPSLKWKTYITYSLINADALYQMDKNKSNFVLVDVRSKEEFNNTSKNYWQNIGQLKGAINIPATDIPASIPQLPADKNTPVIVYGFNAQDEIYESAKKLKQAGYTHVSVLQNGIWYVRWAAHNLKGKDYLNELVINVPEVNQ